jgi:hypothetical protein
MKNLKTFEEFINESVVNEMTENNFQPDELNRSNEIDHKIFKKLMPKSESSSDSATSHIFTYAGNTMFAHYQYHIVKPHGNKPDRRTYRIHQAQYWLNDTQLKWQRRVGEKVNVTLLTVFDITDPMKEINMGKIYVDTTVFLDEMKRVFEIEKQQS